MRLMPRDSKTLYTEVPLAASPVEKGPGTWSMIDTMDRRGESRLVLPRPFIFPPLQHYLHSAR